jgi:hypothetical protein
MATILNALAAQPVTTAALLWVLGVLVFAGYAIWQDWR